VLLPSPNQVTQRLRGKRGPNDTCWCGTGKKYKKCHRDRDRLPLLSVQAIHEGQKRASRNVVPTCLATGLESTPCDGAPIKSHSVSRAESLDRIARQNHVYGFPASRVANFPALKRTGGRLLPRLVGLMQASTFGGFCARHDSAIFRPLDRSPFEPTTEQVALMAYRAVAREIFGLYTIASHVPLMRDSDRGREPIEQLLIQSSVDGFNDHVDERLPPLEAQMRELYEMQKAGRYDRLSYVTLRFSASPQILCSAVFRPEIDLRNRHLMNLYDPAADPRSVAYALLPSGEGTVAVFAWLGAFPEAEAFVNSLSDVLGDRLPTVLTRFMFEMFDNVCMEPDWWEGLPQRDRDVLIDRMSTANLPSPLEESDRAEPSFADPGVTLADWKLDSSSRFGSPSSASEPLAGPDRAGPWREMFARVERTIAERPEKQARKKRRS